MAWYLRKALNFGPLRLNLSKTGIGWSFGVKGARIGSKPSGRRYVHLGRHGIYYRQSLSSGDRQVVPQRRALLSPDSAPSALSPVASVGVEHLTDESSADLLAEIRRVHNRISRVKVALLVGAAACILAVVVRADATVVLALLAVTGVGFIWGQARDREQGHVELTFHLDEPHQGAFDEMVAAFKEVVGAGRVRFIRAKGSTSDQRRQAGATQLLDTATVHPDFQPPPHVACNVPIARLPAGSQMLYPCPDRVLVYHGSEVGAVRYEDLTVLDSVTRFVESEGVPADATVVDHTWRYVNKNGTPDRRFRDNKQIPVALYGELVLQSSAGLNLLFQVSSVSATKRVAAALRAMGQIAESPKLPETSEHGDGGSARAQDSQVRPSPVASPATRAGEPNLRGEALRYARERPTGWEYLVFAHALLEALKIKPEAAGSFGAPPVLLSDGLAVTWCDEQLRQPQVLCDTLGKLVNQDLVQALGPPGQPGDPDALARVAHDLAAACARAREWASWVQRAQGSPKLLKIVRELARTVDDPIQQVEGFGPKLIHAVEVALASPKGSPARNIELDIPLRLTNERELTAAIEELGRPS